jgi:hypothetical protein
MVSELRKICRQHLFHVLRKREATVSLSFGMCGVFEGLSQNFVFAHPRGHCFSRLL